MYEGVKRITSGRPQGLGSGLCDFAQVVRSHVSSKLDYGCVVYGQLGNQSLSLLTVCRLLRCALVLEHSERLRLQVYMWKRENCPLNYDVSNYVYNISVNIDQIHATLLSIVYLVLASNACWYQIE